MIVHFNPRRIRVHHPVYRKAQVRVLTRSMRLHGWKGRSLVGEALQCGDLQAWTGSHRVPAARRARLTSIPVRLVDRAAIGKALGVDPTTIDGALLHHLPPNWYDDDRAAFLKKIGDELGASALATEVEENALERRRRQRRTRRTS